MTTIDTRQSLPDTIAAAPRTPTPISTRAALAATLAISGGVALAGLLGLLTAPAPAQAAPPCSQWSFSGDTHFNQSDNIQLQFNAIGSTIRGPVTGFDEIFSHNNRPRSGWINGGVVNGQGIDIQVRWDDGGVQKYSGEVDANGGVSGNVYDVTPDPWVTPRFVASYTAGGSPLTCTTRATAPTPPAPPLDTSASDGRFPVTPPAPETDTNNGSSALPGLLNPAPLTTPPPSPPSHRSAAVG